MENLENFPCLMQDYKISSNGLQIGLTHILFLFNVKGSLIELVNLLFLKKISLLQKKCWHITDDARVFLSTTYFK